MITIAKASVKDAALIQQLAQEIWYPTYEPILSKEQIDFMLEKMYSVSALEESINQENTEFFLFHERDLAVGFIGMKKKDDVLRIDKLYLLPSTQGKGYGKKFIDFAAKEAKKMGLQALELNVNRNNNAYYFYLKQGFEVVEEVDIPYYQFTMDDYVMRMKLK